MINKISIQNFKSIKKIETETKELNILMGLNGMGKSSYIQSLLLLKQSDKLDKGIVDLNGELTQIGQGKDALYQFAETEKIIFEFLFDNDYTFICDLKYQKEKENLNIENDITKNLTAVFKEKTKQFQYISTERIGPKDLYDASNFNVTDKKQIGLLGEFAAHYINVYGQENTVNESLRHPNASSSKLLSQINAWLQEILPGITLHTKYIPEVNKVILDYQFEYCNQKTNAFRPKNVGFGISYVLPIILTLLTVEKGKIIVIENPESHIHPRGQAELGKLISLAANLDAQFFIETHSDHLLNGIRVAVKEKKLSSSKVKINYFDKITNEKEQYTIIKEIKIDKNGELSQYPKNFLDEWGNQLFKLI